MRASFSLFLILLCSFATIAQERAQTIRELKEKIKDAPTDSLRIKLKYDLVEIYGKDKDFRGRKLLFVYQTPKSLGNY